MLTNGTIKARYISNERSSEFKKGEVYTVSRPICANPERWIAYTDRNGEHYAIPADRFEIIEE